jgi:hypothetical protein
LKEDPRAGRALSKGKNEFVINGKEIAKKRQ